MEVFPFGLGSRGVLSIPWPIQEIENNALDWQPRIGDLIQFEQVLGGNSEIPHNIYIDNALSIC
jgi:hypothetical protein